MIVYKGDVMVQTRQMKDNQLSIKGFNMDFEEIDSYLKQKKVNYDILDKKISLNYSLLREWDFKLLYYFKPFYAPLCDMCCLCTYGRCDLSGNKKGACGINLEKQQSRMVLMSSGIGASTHAAHARHLVDHILEKNPELELEYGNSIEVLSPIITTLTGMTPKNARDLDKVMVCVEKELTNLMAATHTGQEGYYLEFESKAFHAGMIDTLSLEVAELAQINQYDLNKGEADVPMIEIGMGAVDREKPVILCIGHNIVPSSEIIDYAEEMDLLEDLEICGLCCSAIEMGRYSSKSKIIGPISRQLMFIKSGIPDVVVLDEQCIRADIFELCAEKNIPIITTSDNCSLGLPDKTKETHYKIVNEILTGKIPGALIRDSEKVGKAAVDLVIRIKEKNEIHSRLKKLNPDEIDIFEADTKCTTCTHCDTSCLEVKRKSCDKSFISEVENDIGPYIDLCNSCGQCNRTCPAMLPIKEAFEEAKNGDISLMSSFYGKCVGCGNCMEQCEKNIPLIDIIRLASEKKIDSEKFLMRTGRGPIQDVEIRKVGASIVFGDIPGVIALAGCSNYTNGEVEVHKIAEEFLKRGYIVLAAGCAAMDISLQKDEEGKTLYEKYSGDFDRGGLLNLGPCVANAHAIGSAIKIANIFANVPLENNFTEIADYILNRIGVCVIAWGAMSQKAFAIATGANRWGIPAVIGPQASKYKRLYLGNDRELRDIKDKRDGTEVMCEPAPVHLAYSAESLNECMIMAAKLCIRPNDNPRGRMIKLTNYVDIYNRFYGCMPPDINQYVRSEKEIPYQRKDEIKEKLSENNWEPRKSPHEPSIL
ncbi:4Fe-4S dicluster domain-containing protein [Methanobacterium sp.]|uniref:4Fe-4S dicluster domain-containing protein n=1 Tax=Methanobacterium sp. TaxID=2164 RepID=UPI003D64FB80